MKRFIQGSLAVALTIPALAMAHEISVYPGARPNSLEARVVIGDAIRDVGNVVPVFSTGSFFMFYNEGDAAYSSPWGNVIWVGVYGDASPTHVPEMSSVNCVISRDSPLFDRAFDFLTHATGGSTFTVNANAYVGGGVDPCIEFIADASSERDARVRTDMYPLFYTDTYPFYGSTLWGTFATYPQLPDGTPAYIVKSSSSTADLGMVVSAADNLQAQWGQQKTFKCAVDPGAPNGDLYRRYLAAPSRLAVVGLFQAPESTRCERLSIELSSWVTHAF